MKLWANEMSVIVKAPSFWFKKHHILSHILSPLGRLYGFGVRARFALTTPYRSSLPVICIGNFTVGGGGKTPLAIELARLLAEQGQKPVFLTRGYGGQVRGPHLVDLAIDKAMDVGDEPLILAQSAPVVVSADRGKGAHFIEQMDANVILMDDGFQNPTLHKDLTLVVLDAGVGVGNGRIFPAGPLRAGLAFQSGKTDILLIAGGGRHADELRRAFQGDVFALRLEAVGDTDWLHDTKVMAVSGIARPEKFFQSLEALGAVLVKKQAFPDHHMFSEEDARAIMQEAQQNDIHLVMTQKDWVRLPDQGERGRLRKAAHVFYVQTRIDKPHELLARLSDAIFAIQDNA